MRLLAIDPSSRCTGYAVLKGLAPDELIEAGRITPSLARDAFDDVAEPLRSRLLAEEMTHLRRILSITEEVEYLIGDHDPAYIVIEIPSGLVGTGARNGARGSLTTYGLAAGMILAACRAMRCTIPVTERQWARGSKQKRQINTIMTYGSRYDAREDLGGDMSDAICLGRWWIEGGQE